MFEAVIGYVAVNDKGEDKNVKERYIIENGTSFTDVESTLFDKFGTLTGFEVVDIKRSKLKEVANKRDNEEQKIFVATLVDVFHEDDGTEKEIKYDVAFHSETMDSAYKFIKEYASQGYNMSIDKIKKTNFLEVLQ